MDFGSVFNSILEAISKPFTADHISQTALSVILVIAILAGFKILQLITNSLTRNHLSVQASMLLRKIIRYTGYSVVCLMVFDWLGIDVSGILGAAGIAGIAIGFAAQTSVSNLISGVFLIAEKPFSVGDVLTIGEVSGTVMSIDFLSIKIQTFDNRFVRIPNETIIKSNVVNITRYPIRRLDISITVPYGLDMDRVLRLLQSVASDNTHVLDNPEPFIVIDKFSSSGVDILFGVWFERYDFMGVKNSIHIDILRRFAQENIQIPYPVMDIRVNSHTSAI